MNDTLANIFHKACNIPVVKMAMMCEMYFIAEFTEIS